MLVRANKIASSPHDRRACWYVSAKAHAHAGPFWLMRGRRPIAKVLFTSPPA